MTEEATLFKSLFQCVRFSFPTGLRIITEPDTTVPLVFSACWDGADRWSVQSPLGGFRLSAQHGGWTNADTWEMLTDRASDPIIRRQRSAWQFSRSDAVDLAWLAADGYSRSSNVAAAVTRSYCFRPDPQSFSFEPPSRTIADELPDLNGPATSPSHGTFPRPTRTEIHAAARRFVFPRDGSALTSLDDPAELTDLPAFRLHSRDGTEWACQISPGWSTLLPDLTWSRPRASGTSMQEAWPTWPYLLDRAQAVELVAGLSRPDTDNDTSGHPALKAVPPPQTDSPLTHTADTAKHRIGREDRSPKHR